jgi:hypothetical protein
MLILYYIYIVKYKTKMYVLINGNKILLYSILLIFLTMLIKKFINFVLNGDNFINSIMRI